MTETGNETRTRARFEVPEELRADVRLLGELLGKVLVEYAGQPLLDDVEKLRELTIAGDGAAAEQLVASWPHRAGRRRRARVHLLLPPDQPQRGAAPRPRPARPGPAPATRRPCPSWPRRSSRSPPTAASSRPARCSTGSQFRPVLTAHPTEARRRAVLGAIRRISSLLDERGDPRTGDSELAENRRRLIEQVDILWRTSQLRTSRPSPLDEVRSAMAVFEETLFDVVGNVYRRLDDALAGDAAGAKQPVVAPFVRLGSWIGGDRDGNPNVTAAITREAADPGRARPASSRTGHGSPRPGAHPGRGHHAAAPQRSPLLEDARAVNPDLIADIEARSPASRTGAPAARRAPDRRDPGSRRGLRLPRASDFLHDLKVAAGLPGDRRCAAPGVRRAPAAHLAGRDRSASTWPSWRSVSTPRSTPRRWRRCSAAASCRPDRGGAGDAAGDRSVQQRYGAAACRRYIVSFTQSRRATSQPSTSWRRSLPGRRARRSRRRPAVRDR